MNGARSTLDGDVRTEVKVELVGMSATRLHESTGKGVLVAITLVREEADVVALACNHNRELGDRLAAQLLEAVLEVANLFLENGGVLT